MKKNIFEEELYKKIGINNLIIFAVYSFENSGEKCTFEKLVEKCFYFFPKSFSLFGISKWPDSRKLDRPLRTLRKNKLISGNLQKNLTLAKAGKKIAQDISRILNQRKLI